MSSSSTTATSVSAPTRASTNKSKKKLGQNLNKLIPATAIDSAPQSRPASHNINSSNAGLLVLSSSDASGSRGLGSNSGSKGRGGSGVPLYWPSSQQQQLTETVKDKNAWGTTAATASSTSLNADSSNNKSATKLPLSSPVVAPLAAPTPLQNTVATAPSSVSSPRKTNSKLSGPEISTATSQTTSLPSYNPATTTTNKSNSAVTKGTNVNNNNNNQHTNSSSQGASWDSPRTLWTPTPPATKSGSSVLAETSAIPTRALYNTTISTASVNTNKNSSNNKQASEATGTAISTTTGAVVVHHVASYEDRNRGDERPTAPRMLYDPKSGSMVAVKENNNSSNSSSGKHQSLSSRNAKPKQQQHQKTVHPTTLLKPPENSSTKQQGPLLVSLGTTRRGDRSSTAANTSNIIHSSRVEDKGGLKHNDQSPQPSVENLSPKVPSRNSNGTNRSLPANNNGKQQQQQPQRDNNRRTRGRNGGKLGNPVHPAESSTANPRVGKRQNAADTKISKPQQSSGKHKKDTGTAAALLYSGFDAVALEQTGMMRAHQSGHYSNPPSTKTTMYNGMAQMSRRTDAIEEMMPVFPVLKSDDKIELLADCDDYNDGELKPTAKAFAPSQGALLAVAMQQQQHQRSHSSSTGGGGGDVEIEAKNGYSGNMYTNKTKASKNLGILEGVHFDNGNEEIDDDNNSNIDDDELRDLIPNSLSLHHSRVNTDSQHSGDAILDAGDLDDLLALTLGVASSSANPCLTTTTSTSLDVIGSSSVAADHQQRHIFAFGSSGTWGGDTAAASGSDWNRPMSSSSVLVGGGLFGIGNSTISGDNSTMDHPWGNRSSTSTFDGLSSTGSSHPSAALGD